MSEDSGMWVKVYPEYAGGAVEGSPPAPILTNPEGGSVIEFTSGGDGSAGPTLAYGATITPDATLTVDQDNLEVQVSGTEPFTDYVVSVYAVNIAGRGDSATTDAFQLNYNDATGGDDPEGTEYTNPDNGQRWRYHQFTAVGTSTFTVEAAHKPFEVLVVGGSGGGGANRGGGTTANNGGGGHAGGVVTQQMNLSEGDFNVTVGAGGAGRSGFNISGSAGSQSIFDTVAAPGGGGGPTNNPVGGNGAGGGASGQTGGPPVYNTITGSDQPYAGGGNASTATHGDAGAGAGPGGGGGGGGGDHSTSGKSGIVIVAYQIGTSTSRQIQQAEAEAAAREEGYESGYSVGVADGREEVSEQLRSMAASTQEASE